MIRRSAERVAILLNVLHLLLNMTGVGSPAFFVYAAVLAILVSLIVDMRRSAYVISANLTLAYLFIIPTIGSLIFDNYDYSYIVSLAFLFFVAVRYLSGAESGSVAIILHAPTGRNSNYILAVCFISCIVGPYVVPRESVLANLSFLLPFAVSLVFFETFCINERKSKIAVVLILYFFVILNYVIFYWGGFGRILIGAYILVPILLANSVRDIGVRSWQGIVLAMPALYISQQSRYGEVGLESLYGGSAAHHLIVTDEMFRSMSTISHNWLMFAEQWLLFYLNWMPRDFWSDKPIGVGYSFVDDWIGRAGFSDGFSVSVGFIGELIFYVGDLWWMTFVLCALTLVATRMLVGKLGSGYLAPMVVFDVSLLSYAWGGLATFGSRAWFMIFPLVLLIAVVLPRLRLGSYGRWAQFPAHDRRK